MKLFRPKFWCRWARLQTSFLLSSAISHWEDTDGACALAGTAVVQMAGDLAVERVAMDDIAEYVGGEGDLLE